MKWLVFVSAVLFLIFWGSAAGCVHLVIKPDLSLKLEEVPDQKAIEELNLLLDAVVYPRQYEMNVFDCSNMTACMCDFLTAKNYRCVIVLGTNSLWRLLFGDELGRGHVWIIAEKNGKKFWVESTTRATAASFSYGEYFWQLHFNSLKELKKFWERWHLPKGEWDY